MLFFENLGFKSTSRRKPIGWRSGFASDAQIDMIRALWQTWSDSGSEAGLNAWLENHFKVSALRFLPASAAPKVIEGLKAMNCRKSAARPAAGDPAA